MLADQLIDSCKETYKALEQLKVHDYVKFESHELLFRQDALDFFSKMYEGTGKIEFLKAIIVDEYTMLHSCVVSK